ncbi:DUF448 domain-containing protein [Helicobacter sp. 11S03491-1]|uniref:DUF448 domain-containing protein n=1 Tax=Helicobacter sp. 11S03491-1 TaxID=1476196 RepID=UPI000BA77D29|nr:DUF448 domain-containing protein [Helicobacter sp. 11S03491-1]
MDKTPQFKRFSSKKAMRMCICCRKRLIQNELLRFKIEHVKIKLFDGNGRSFYICKECMSSDKIIGSLAKLKNAPKDKNIIKEHIEEIRSIWQKLD